MNRFKITNKKTGEIRTEEAHYLNEAIAATGWDPEDCNVVVEVSSPETDPPKKRRGRPRKDKSPTALPQKPPAGQGKAAGGTVVVCSVCGDQAGSDSPEGWALGNDGWLCVKCLLVQKETQEAKGVAVPTVVGGPTIDEAKAQQHKQEIEKLAIEAEVMFLRMGQLLHGAREAGEWTILHYETFREYIEDLKLPMTNSYSWATRLINIYQYMVINMGLDSKMLASIGVSKLTRLLPLARKGELTQEVLDAAKVLSDIDLRKELGQNVGGAGGSEEMMIVCPRCGHQFDARHASRVE